MEMHTDNPNGQPNKGKEKRETVVFSLQPSTIEWIRKVAEKNHCSQSDIIEAVVKEVLIMSKSTYFNLRRCALFADGEYFGIEDLPVFYEASGRSDSTSNDDFALRPGNEREQIEAALNKARGNKAKAARLLQIDRKTLYNKMHQLGLEL